MQHLQGLGVSEGVAIGRAVVLERRHEEFYRFPLPVEQIDSEIERFRHAAGEARKEIHSLAARVGEELGGDLGGIFEAHALLLRDRSLLERIEKRIREEHVNAEWAAWETTEALREQFASLQDERFRDRSEDLVDVGRALIRALQGYSHHELSEIKGGVIVIADDLTPSDAVRLGREGVGGFAIEVGGRTSHTAIIAHSLDIPLVTGLPGITKLAAHDDPVVVDGTNGTVILHPSPAIISEYTERRVAAKGRIALLESTRTLPAVTRDGVRIQMMANIDLVEELDDAVRFGAEGVGLYRSEFLYIERAPELPSEDDHVEVYRRLLDAVAPNPAIIRTFDLGGRKLAREVLETREDNPVLGLRGVRLTLARPDFFRSQLRALFRAGCFGDLQVMLPLVSTVEEVRRFRAFSAEVMTELDAEGVAHCDTFALGVMIEVPSAALIADRLAAEADFFSIGTNDLIQYSMAVDRNNEHVTDLYQPFHPAILHMICSVAEAGRRAGIPVSVCGEMAADPLGAAVLVGAGIRRLSVSPRRVPTIKTTLRELSAEELVEHVSYCRHLATAAEVEAYLRDAVGDELRTAAETMAE